MNPNIVWQRGSIDQYLQIYLILLEEGDRNCRLDHFLWSIWATD
ncbi:hypothetical protein QUA54_19250 [Microcoleus sp. MOSTC5]